MISDRFSYSSKLNVYILPRDEEELAETKAPGGRIFPQTEAL
jgi:hypothetical protein